MLVFLQGDAARSIQCHGIDVFGNPLHWYNKWHSCSACCFCGKICFLQRKSCRDVFGFIICICSGIFSDITFIQNQCMEIAGFRKLSHFLSYNVQVVIEFPYVFAQAIIYSSIFYSMASFLWTFDRFIWYLFFMYFTMLYFTFYGMMTTAVTPNHNVAAIIAAPFYMLWNLFSGFMIPHKVWKLILHCFFLECWLIQVTLESMLQKMPEHEMH